MESTGDILVMTSFVIGIVLIVFILARYNYLIKKAMIERGLTQGLSDAKTRYIDVGCLVLGLGIGMLVSSFFTQLDLDEGTMELIVWGIILIFGGLGVIGAHFLRKRMEK
ncbi:DUF6249 domain-containing protein [uncultured Kordia sp.]|uniref:DUF6249 domain-containing protein n=1 Tax=uncultured Kordia sp. TaxID=507699 RepID=UPI00261578E8|nr:DUF6249 domain-containing protein [uncultured Kordia sp.]